MNKREFLKLSGAATIGAVAASNASAAADADGVDAITRHRLGMGLQPHVGHDLDHPLGQNALAGCFGVAFVADHLGKRLKAGLLVYGLG